MDQSWDKSLTEFISQFIEATNNQLYQMAFLKLAATLNDGHAYITPVDQKQIVYLDAIKFINGETIVGVDAGGLQKGDIIYCIEQRNIGEVRDSLSVYTPASTQWNKEYRVNCLVAEMIFSYCTNVTILRDNKKQIINTFPVVFDTKQDSYRWIYDEIGYVDLSTITTEKIEPMFHSFSKAEGIIFDLRRPGPYAFDIERLACFLFDKKNIRLFSMTIPDLAHPGSFCLIKNIETTIPGSMKCPLYKGKIVVLINESTQSSSETIAWELYNNNNNSTLVGRQTSGTLGRVTWIPLLNGHKTAFSSVGLFSTDNGMELQRKGLIPDIEVYPTIESILAGEDEILETGIN